MPTNVIDFKNQGAYIIPKGELSKIKSDLYESFVNIFGEDSIIAKIFFSKDQFLRI